MCVSGVRGNNNYIPDNTKVNKSSSEKPSTASEPKTQEVSVSKQDKANMSETKQSAKFDPANSNISFGEIKKENKSDEQKIHYNFQYDNVFPEKNSKSRFWVRNQEIS